MKQYLGYSAIIVALLNGNARAAESPVEATIVDVKRIADDAPHSAFTDLIAWNDQFICAFRQGRGHVSADGRITVLTSPDGEKWTKAAELKSPGLDLRDASLSETPDGSLMLIGGASPREADDESAPTGSFVAFSDDAREWTTPEIVVEPGRWLWRVTWHEARRMASATRRRPIIRWHRSWSATTAGSSPRPFRGLLDEGCPTEAVIRFAGDGTAYCLQRRDGKPEVNSAYLGVSKAPYTEWEWHDLGLYLRRAESPSICPTVAGSPPVASCTTAPRKPTSPCSTWSRTRSPRS